MHPLQMSELPCIQPCSIWIWGRITSTYSLMGKGISQLPETWAWVATGRYVFRYEHLTIHSTRPKSISLRQFELSHWQDTWLQKEKRLWLLIMSTQLLRKGESKSDGDEPIPNRTRGRSPFGSGPGRTGSKLFALFRACDLC